MPSEDGANPAAEQHEASAITPLLSSQRRDETSLESQQAYARSAAWDAKGNTRNPRNWKGWFKWLTVALVSFIEFLTYVPRQHLEM